MEKNKFYVVYIEDSKTGNRLDCGDINNRLSWIFYDEDSASAFASLLRGFLFDRYTPCVAECCSVDFMPYHVYIP